MARTASFCSGASLKALERLGRTKGYCLVGCNYTGVTAFFVREDLAADRFAALSPQKTITSRLVTSSGCPTATPLASGRLSSDEI